MDASLLTEKAGKYLNTLCKRISNRRVGGEGNRLATSFFAETMQSFEFEVECPEFECMDWQSGGASISVAGESIEAQASPYSRGIEGVGRLLLARSAGELYDLELAGNVLLMRGELTKEQFMPRNFPFFRVDEQQQVIQFLESSRPLAIITATRRNPEMAGALYPFPVFEDGDFDVPSAFISAEQGDRLARHEGQELTLAIRAERLPSRGCNVVARKGKDAGRRVVLLAHIDAKLGTPGALDNGTGIITLLLLGELLRDYTGRKSIEIVALNGEDYYSNPGEQLYLQQNEGRFHEIALGVNIDGMGFIHGRTAYSLYDCPPEMASLIQRVFSAPEVFVASEPWFQGDHALFLMNGRPALALTSELAGELMTEFIHTDQDTPEIVHPGKVAETALALHRLLRSL